MYYPHYHLSKINKEILSCILPMQFLRAIWDLLQVQSFFLLNYISVISSMFIVKFVQKCQYCYTLFNQSILLVTVTSASVSLLTKQLRIYNFLGSLDKQWKWGSQIIQARKKWNRRTLACWVLHGKNDTAYLLLAKILRWLL